MTAANDFFPTIPDPNASGQIPCAGGTWPSTVAFPSIGSPGGIITFVPAVRSEVFNFAQQMEKVLQQNDWKGGWKQCSREFILHKLEEEYHELRAAILTDKGPFKILKEAADLANVSMFAADLFGGLNAISN